MMDHVRNYRDTLLDTLMYYQAIEDLLKTAIRISNEILDISSHPLVKYQPNQRSLDDLNKKGLGGLLDLFRTIGPNTGLCDRLQRTVNTRNKIAHAEAKKLLKVHFTENDLKQFADRSHELRETSNELRTLYLELNDLYQELLRTRNLLNQPTFASPSIAVE